MTKEIESEEIIIGIETARENLPMVHLNPEGSNCQGGKLTLLSSGELICSSCGLPVVIGIKSDNLEKERT